MRREGRQRGMVRTFPVLSTENNPQPRSGRSLNELREPPTAGLCTNAHNPRPRSGRSLIRAPPTAGLFTKAPSRPTNHSKFTGKCGRPKCRDCHIEPACKSKDKAKGTHKSRTTPSDPGLVSVVGPATGGENMCGFSAFDVLEHLDGFGYDFLLDDDECCEEKFSSQPLVSCC